MIDLFSIVKLLCLVYIAIGGIYGSLRHIQMLQQNSYFISRYKGWLKSSFSLKCFYAAIPVVLLYVLSLLSDVLFIIVALLISVYRIYKGVKVQNKSIKKLVYTARIKRLIFTQSVLFAVLCAVFSMTYSFLAIIPIAFFFCPPASVITAFFINSYPEKAISKHYVNDAKKILENSGNLKVIGVTGSYGKTGTKFILSKFLSSKYNVVATPGSFNTPMGVVRTVRENLRHDTEIFICEMGAKNVGDIKEICEIAHPDIGIITSVGAQHLETFGNTDNVFRTKFELADEIAKNGGICFINGDSKEIAARRELITGNAVFYGTSHRCGCKVSDITYSKDGSEFTVSLPDGSDVRLSTPLLGRHSVINIAGAAALASALGVEKNDLSLAASRLKPTEHRLELKSWINGSVMIDDAYNANPEGCIEAVSVLNSFTGMKKIIVTPGLVELGEKEYEFNYNLGTAAAKVCDGIVLVGKKRSVPMKNAADDAGYPSDRISVVERFTDAVALLTPILDKDTVVLIENDLPDNYAV